jgi:hypothetical protein
LAHCWLGEVSVSRGGRAAIRGMHYAMAGGGGPAGTEARASADEVGFSVLRQASTSSLSPSNLKVVSVAIRHWGVTPVDAGLPIFSTALGTGYGVAFFNTVLGWPPAYQDQARVGAGHGPALVTVAAAAFANCTEQDAAGGSSGGAFVAQRVLDGSSGSAHDPEPNRP